MVIPLELMTTRQRLLRLIYPLWMRLTNLTGKRSATYKSRTPVKPPESFYRLHVILNDGRVLQLSALRGKKVLLVNTASDCGYTSQYKDLQQLYEQYKDRLEVIGFPANDFKEQEKGTDEEIAAFCKSNYGVSFPLAKKTAVIGPGKNDVFRWLADKDRNGWNDQEPTWNFSKYLVSEEGVLLQYFDPGISPVSEEVIQMVTKK